MTNVEFLKLITPWWIVMAGIGAGFGYLVLVATAPVRAKDTATCDRAAHLLLATDNMVELERSKYLIEKLTCSVRRPLEPAS
jgi:hypothetical protein